MRKIEEILKNERIWDATRYTKPGYYPMYTAWVKLPYCGTCSVVWSDCEEGMEHVSVSPKKQFRMPSWDDMCVLKDIFFEDEEEVYQIHPKKSQYVNMMENCLHLWKPKGHELNELEKVKKPSRWIPVSERMPEERDSIFAVHKGTDKWKNGMFEKTSKKVLVTVAYNDGSRGTHVARTVDGKWRTDNFLIDSENIVAWMPLPEPWKGE